MKRLLAALLIAGTAMAHVPVITPSDVPHGDTPPVLGDKPLPPMILTCPFTGIPIIL